MWRITRIPVQGFVVHSGENSSDHSHKLYITSWDGRAVHVHPFGEITSHEVGHSHHYGGTTDPAPSGVQHTHSYYAETTLNGGHFHCIQGVTGPAIPLPGGGHIHHFAGATTVNGRIPHVHYYSGETGNAAKPPY